MARSATMDDAALLWEWANEEVVRGNSFSPKPIPFPDHVNWLRRRLGCGKCLILVLETDGVPIGQVRYDKVANDTAEIDMSVAPAYRGYGYGRRALTLTREHAIERLGVVRVRGTVLETNTSSIATFVKAGFEESQPADVEGRVCRVFVWQCDEG